MKYLLTLLLVSATTLAHSQSYEAGLETGLSIGNYASTSEFENNNYTSWANGIYIKRQLPYKLSIKIGASLIQFSPTYGPIFPEYGQVYYSTNAYRVTLDVDRCLYPTNNKKITLNMGIGLSALIADQKTDITRMGGVT